MELRRYFRVLLHWWWLALIALVVVIIGSVVFTYTQSPQYEATASLVVSPASAMADLSDVRASLSTLDKPVIANTYAEIAQSRTVVQQAWGDLNVAPESRQRFEIHSSVLQETSFVLITVEGPDPAIVQSLANNLAHHTVDYVSGLYEVYDLKLLDAAEYPDSPTSPNEPLNLLLGSVLGLCFGALAAFVAEYLQTPIQEASQFAIVDANTGAYKPSYFMQRLREEISRSKRNQRPFSVTRIQIDDPGGNMHLYPPETRELLLREIVQVLKQALHQEDIVASWGNEELIVLLPDCDEATAKQIFERLLTKIQWTPFKIEDTGLIANITANAGIATCSNGTSPDELIVMAGQALQQAKVGNVSTHALAKQES